jgi:hypothetical protein
MGASSAISPIVDSPESGDIAAKSLEAQWPVSVFVLTVQISEFRLVARDSGTYSLGVK